MNLLNLTCNRTVLLEWKATSLMSPIWILFVQTTNAQSASPPTDSLCHGCIHDHSDLQAVEPALQQPDDLIDPGLMMKNLCPVKTGLIACKQLQIEMNIHGSLIG